MKCLIGIGECGGVELFGGTSICCLYIPPKKLPIFREQFLGYLGKDIDDYTAFDMVKSIFPNYVAQGYNLTELFTSSHYYELETKSPAIGVVNYMTDAPDFVVGTLDHVLGLVYTPGASDINSMVSYFRGFGAMIHFLLLHVEELLMQEMIDIVETAEIGLYDRNDRLEISHEADNPTDYAIVNLMASAISRVGYLSQIQQLEKRCGASLPRGITAEVINFYLRRCESMTPEEKNQLFKVFLMEKKGGYGSAEQAC